MKLKFLPKDRKQNRLLMIFLILLILGGGLYWYAYLREEGPVFFRTQPPPPKQVQFDFSIFENPVFLELGQPRTPVQALTPDESGKINPFAP